LKQPIKKATKIFLFIILFSGTTNAQILNKIHWLVGNWEYKSKINITESWRIVSDTLLAGNSYTIRGTDTLSSEKTEIVLKRGKLIYNVQVKEQNNGIVIPFLMTKCTNDSLIFENVLHDFPQKIIYKKIDNDNIVAAIEGKIEGKTKHKDFFYKRVK